MFFITDNTAGETNTDLPFLCPQTLSSAFLGFVHGFRYPTIPQSHTEAKNGKIGRFLVICVCLLSLFLFLEHLVIVLSLLQLKNHV